MKVNYAKKPLVLIGAIIALVSGLPYINILFNIPAIASWVTSSDNPAPILTVVYVSSGLLRFIAPAVLLIGLFVGFKRGLLVTLLVATAALGIPTSIILDLLSSSIQHYAFDLGSSLWNPAGDINYHLEQAGDFVVLVGLALGLIGLFQAPSSVSAAAPSAGEPLNGAPASSLPLLALIFGLVAPIVGVILGHVAISQMKQGRISNTDRSLAKLGLVFGYVLSALGFLVVVGYMVFVLALFSRYSY